MAEQSFWKCKRCGTINKAYYLNCMHCASYQTDHKKKRHFSYTLHSSL